MAYLLVLMLQEDIDKMVERRIMESPSFLQQVLVEACIIVMNHLRDDRQRGRLGLQYHLASLALSPGPSAHLSHHHKGMLVGSEVGIIEHGIGIQYAHHTHLVEIQSLGDHLGANEQIGLTRREIIYQPLVSIAGTGGVQIHTGDTSLGKDIRQLVFDAFGTQTSPHEFCTSTVGALHWHRISISAIVTGEQVDILMKCKRHIAVLALRHPSAYLTFHHRCKATTVLEQNGLFAMRQSLAYGC